VITAAIALLSLAPNVKYIDNGRIQVGLDLSRGGAITHLSRVGGPNFVNNHDLGRQIQMSYYSGPVPYEPDGKKPMPFWAGLGWNPIQSGDVYNHPSKILESKFEKTKAYVKCIPMHWPLDNVPGECVFESWVEIKGNAVMLRQRITNNRPDKTQYAARPQELPAVYLNGPWHKLMTYRGDLPFTNAPLVEVPKIPWDENGPWTTFYTPECWAALVDDTGDGVGVWSPGNPRLSGGFVGEPGKGGTLDGPTGYISPIKHEILDHNIAFDSKCALIVGSLSEIRKWVYAQPRPSKAPSWTFNKDRQGWHYVNASDSGWPLPGALEITLDRPDPQLVSPMSYWKASDAKTLVLEVSGAMKEMGEVFWARQDSPNFSPQMRLAFELPGGEKPHRVRIPLGKHPEYKGNITQIRIDPVLNGGEGKKLRVYRIWLE
jgi:hypothetical protein